ncbi:MAG: hypothetical protein ACT4OP_02220 [Actinomycetota bacterium]
MRGRPCFSVPVIPCLFNLARLSRWRDPTFFACFWGLLLCYAAARTPLVRALVWLGAAAFLTAYSIWLTGTGASPSCRPDSIVQPHAIWHLLSALAVYSFFRFFRTERQTIRRHIDRQPLMEAGDQR